MSKPILFPTIALLSIIPAIAHSQKPHTIAQLPQTATIVVNEIVTDPQQDWNDSAGGNGVAFDTVPGSGSITESDEWLELYNAGSAAIDLTAGAGWALELVDSSPATLNFNAVGSTVLVFSAGGSVTDFRPGEYLVIGNPPGAMNNDIFIVLRDASGTVVAEVEIGADFENDGPDDGAPDGGSSDGNASSSDDEAVARFPNGVDSGNDVDDFVKQRATIGAANGTLPTEPAVVRLNEIVTDPQQDWSDNSGGNGIAFDATPGDGSITDSDEWLELYNAGTSAVNLTLGSGWTILFQDGSPATLRFADPGSAILRFSAGGALTHFQPGEYLVIGNPSGSMSNNIYLALLDPSGALIDAVELGDDFAGDGSGDGAPDGNAAGFSDEAVARFPNAVDTDDDPHDFAKQAATIGASNGELVFAPVIAVQPSTHDFGAMAIGEAAERAFVVTNSGNALLTMTQTTMTGDDATAFVIVAGAAPFALAPGDSQPVVLRFQPDSAQTYAVVLGFESNDPQHNPLDVPLTGVGFRREPCVADFSAEIRFGISPFTVQLTDLSRGQIETYRWDFGDGSFSDEQNPTHTYTADCTDPRYTVKLTVRGSCGVDSVTKTDFVIVHPPSECGFFGCPTWGAPPLRVGFNNFFADYATGYLWDFGDGTTSSEFEPVHTFTRTGRFAVSLTVHTPLGSATVRFDDYINVQPHYVEPAPTLAVFGPDFTQKSTGGEDRCGWNLWSNGFLGETLTTVGERRWFVFEVIAAGTYAADEWSRMALVVDDSLAGEEMVANRQPSTYRFPVPLAGGQHMVKVFFTNDTVEAITGADRNLLVQRLFAFDSGEPLAVPGHLAAADMALKSAGAPVDSGWNLFTYGFLGHGLTVSDSGRYTLSIRAGGHAAQNQLPRLVVQVDTTAQDTLALTAEAMQTYRVPLALAAGLHLLRLQFVNNYFDPIRQDYRNVVVRQISLEKFVPPPIPRIVINEIISDPQQDWNDSDGGNGVPFDAIPGSGTISTTDEWVELFNADSATVDLTAGGGWQLEFSNGTSSVCNFRDAGSSVLRFSAGGSVANFLPGEYLVIGNPSGSVNNSVFVTLRDGSGRSVDDVELGDDYENDGDGDGAPDGGSGGGNASGLADEATARFPNATDTGDDVADFGQMRATPGAANLAGDPVIAMPLPVSDIEAGGGTVPSDLQLYANYPNPFNPATKIVFDLPEPVYVLLTVHNLTGQEVARLQDDNLAAGRHTREWRADRQASGIYLYRLLVVDRKAVRKSVLVRKMLLTK